MENFMKNAFASRTLYVAGKSTTKCIVQIYAPVLNQHGTFDCEVQIENAPEGLNKMTAGGSDSYHALLLAIKMLHGMINVYNTNYMDSKLRWVDDSESDLGFAISTDK